MTYQLIDGRYQVPLVEFGKKLQSRGWNVAEHSAFGGVSPVHAPNSYHKYDEALDITWKNNEYGDYDPSGKIGWNDWTNKLGNRLKGAGPEVLYRDTDPNHPTHVHLAAKNGILNLSPEQMSDFGFDIDGNVVQKVNNESDASAGTGALTDFKATDVPTPTAEATATETRGKAKEKAQAYKDMSKSEMNAAYDAMRSDPAKAEAEGMKMHKAFFNK